MPAPATPRPAISASPPVAASRAPRTTAARALVLAFLSTVSLAALGLAPTLALDLNSNDGLITETIASRDRLRHYDNIKKYGAEAISERDRADYEPLGLRAGNYRIFPELGATVVYDNNIFGSNANRKADVRTELTPSLVFKSELPRHVLDLSLGGRIINYLAHEDQSYANAYADLKGALHVDAAHTIAAEALTALDHEERQDTSASRLAAGPLAVWHNRAAIGITRDVGRLYGTLSGTYDSRRFGSVASTAGGTLDQSYRDTDVFSGQVKGGYRFSPGFDLVTRASMMRILNDGDGKTSRTGLGTEAVAGLSLETSPLLRWRLLGGWGYRTFDQANLAEVRSFLAEGQMQWLVTQQLTFYGTLSRSIADEVAANGGGLVRSKVEARLEYELWRNLVLSATGSAAIDEFQGVARTDYVYSGGAGIEYWANKNWLFTFGYEHEQRDSSDVALTMTRDKFSIGAKLHF